MAGSHHTTAAMLLNNLPLCIVNCDQISISSCLFKGIRELIISDICYLEVRCRLVARVYCMSFLMFFSFSTGGGVSDRSPDIVEGVPTTDT